MMMMVVMICFCLLVSIVEVSRRFIWRWRRYWCVLFVCCFWIEDLASWNCVHYRQLIIHECWMSCLLQWACLILRQAWYWFLAFRRNSKKRDYGRNWIVHRYECHDCHLQFTGLLSQKVQWTWQGHLWS